LASITPGIESNPGKENTGIETPSPLLKNDWFSIGRVERSSRMGGKFDPIMDTGGPMDGLTADQCHG
jgi:hypothetical protein